VRDTDTTTNARRPVDDDIPEHAAELGNDQGQELPIRHRERAQPEVGQDPDVELVRPSREGRTRVRTARRSQDREATLDVAIRRVGSHETHGTLLPPGETERQFDGDAALVGPEACVRDASRDAIPAKGSTWRIVVSCHREVRRRNRVSVVPRQGCT
jgi:hypothetical protein